MREEQDILDCQKIGLVTI